MLKYIKYASAIVSIALLTACGGGGGGGSQATQDPTFDLQKIYESYLDSSHSYAEVLTGSTSSESLTGKGTRAIAAITEDTSEDNASLVVKEIRVGIINGLAGVSNDRAEINYYYNPSKQMIGYTRGDIDGQSISQYGVIQGAPSGFPALAKVGDQGKLYTMDVYTDVSMTTLFGTLNATWTLKAGQGPALAMLEISESLSNSSSPIPLINTTVKQYSIGQDNKLTLVKEQSDSILGGTLILKTITSTFTE